MRSHGARLRYSISAILLIIGTNVFTYAQTRFVTTDRVVGKAKSAAEEFLVQNGFLPPFESAPPVSVNDKIVCGKEFITRIGEAGGSKRWRNHSVPFLGLGILLAVTGALLQFVTKKKVGRNENESPP
jgi:hypothetical protein